MTNQEKYKTAKERRVAFKKFCDANDCHTCPLSEEGDCKFGWLDLEAPMTATEVVDILAEHSKWRRGEGKYAGSEVLGIAIDRAVEILRSVKE